MAGRRTYLQIYGDDYPTADGTCIRDYIHVCDLAAAHLLGLQQLLSGRDGHHVYNLGNGTGYSVQQVIDTAKALTQRGLLAHVAIDDATRLVYVEVLPDEKQATTVGFLLRAVAWFRCQGISCRRVLSDKASAYSSRP